ncbi:hypothetical protein [Halococcus sp. AFM35]|uniref:hypothetical protein n=1 Tax=Halococcus sp. AFM35 TaxID=3421653 RepID=UPI003EBB0C54
MEEANWNGLAHMRILLYILAAILAFANPIPGALTVAILLFVIALLIAAFTYGAGEADNGLL